MKELQNLGYSLTFEFIYIDNSPLIEQVRRYPGYETSFFDQNGKLIKE